jgi:plastocyanin
MTWRWLICFSALSGTILTAANVAGRVELRDSKDPAVRKKQDYSGVVVWLERIDKSATAAKAAPIRAKILQKDKAFTPHVLVVPTGSTVDFPNLDPVFHNAFSNYDGQVFDVGLYPPGGNRSVHFARAGIVRIFCNIHASMTAIVAVLDSAWYDTTKADGHFELRDVPPGEYELKVFHERATAASLAAAERPVLVTTQAQTLPNISVSESGYLSIPHKDKYGRDYKPVPEDSGAYPGKHK